MENLIKILPFIIAILGILLSFYTFNKTISTQFKIKKLDMSKDFKKKYIDDYLDIYFTLKKKYFLIDLPEIYELPKNYYYELHKEKLNNINDFIAECTISLERLTETMQSSNMIMEIQSEIRIAINAILSFKHVINYKLNDDDMSEMINIFKSNVDRLFVTMKKCIEYEKENLMMLYKEDEVKANKLISWFRKSWKEIGEYKV